MTRQAPVEDLFDAAVGDVRRIRREQQDRQLTQAHIGSGGGIGRATTPRDVAGGRAGLAAVPNLAPYAGEHITLTGTNVTIPGAGADLFTLVDTIESPRHGMDTISAVGDALSSWAITATGHVRAYVRYRGGETDGGTVVLNVGGTAAPGAWDDSGPWNRFDDRRHFIAEQGDAVTVVATPASGADTQADIVLEVTLPDPLRSLPTTIPADEWTQVTTEDIDQIVFDGTYWWGHRNGTTVLQYNTSWTELSSFTVENGLGITWDGSELWIKDSELVSDILREYTTGGTSTGSTITATSTAVWGVAYDTSAGTFWVTDRTPALKEFNTSGTLLTTLNPSVSTNLFGAAMMPNGDIAIIDVTNDQIAVIDETSGAVNDTIDLSDITGTPTGLWVAANGEDMWVAAGSNGVWKRSGGG